MHVNPYSPPGDTDSSQFSPAGDPRYGSFVPLAWRTTMVLLGLGATCIFSFVVDAANLAFGADLDREQPNLGAALFAAAGGLGLVASHVFCATFFCIWIHRAAKNLPALGRTGMQFTPGWAVGWFFVPIANLVKPFHVMNEVWRASAPDAENEPFEWRNSPGTTLLGVWWAAWIAGNVVANTSARIHDSSMAGAVGILGTLLELVAAVSCGLLLRQIAARQEERARASVPSQMP